MQYDASNLVIHPGGSREPGLIVEVTPKNAGWNTLSFQARDLSAGQSWSFATGQNELALVVLSGSLDVESNRGQWQGIGERVNVFAGLPSALYLPAQTDFQLRARSDAQFAAAWAPVSGEVQYAPRLIKPADSSVEIRGGDHATRQINSIIPPGFPCERLVVVEVYTPGGNWSSYPPHKHDVHKTGSGGEIFEADLDEIYYYQIDRPDGYAIQRVYTDPESPLHRAGFPIDAAVLARHHDVVLVPEGYHPVSSPPGYTSYYLNILAGSAQSLAASDDPRYAWVKGTYQSLDPRVPIFPIPNLTR